MFRQGIYIDLAASPFEVVRHVEQDKRRQSKTQDRGRESKLAAEVRDVDDQDDGVRLRDIVHVAAQYIVRDLLVFRPWVQAIDARQIDQKDVLATKLGTAKAFLDCYTGVVSYFLTEPG